MLKRVLTYPADPGAEGAGVLRGPSPGYPEMRKKQGIRTIIEFSSNIWNPLSKVHPKDRSQIDFNSLGKINFSSDIWNPLASARPAQSVKHS